MLAELVELCIREIGFAGQPGLSFQQLKSFIETYHTRRFIAQLVDDDYINFVWTLLREDPDVRVGMHVPYMPGPEWTAQGKQLLQGPGASQATGAAAASTATAVDSGPAVNQAQEAGTSTATVPKVKITAARGPNKRLKLTDPLFLDSVAVEQGAAATHLSIKELQQVFGAQALRFTLTPVRIWSYMTLDRLSSSMQRASLTHDNYCVLQRVARAGRTGVLLTELTQAMRFDPKKTFAQCKVLIQEGLIVKTHARKLISAVPMVVHRRFADATPPGSVRTIIGNNLVELTAEGQRASPVAGADTSGAQAHGGAAGDAAAADVAGQQLQDDLKEPQAVAEDAEESEAAKGRSEEELEQIKAWIGEPISSIDASDDCVGASADGPQQARPDTFHAYDSLSDTDRYRIMTTYPQVIVLRLLKLLRAAQNAGSRIERRSILMRLGWRRLDRPTNSHFHRTATRLEQQGIVQPIIAQGTSCLQITLRGLAHIGELERALLRRAGSRGGVEERARHCAAAFAAARAFSLVAEVTLERHILDLADQSGAQGISTRSIAEMLGFAQTRLSERSLGDLLRTMCESALTIGDRSHDDDDNGGGGGANNTSEVGLAAANGLYFVTRQVGKMNINFHYTARQTVDTFATLASMNDTVVRAQQHLLSTRHAALEVAGEVRKQAPVTGREVDTVLQDARLAHCSMEDTPGRKAQKRKVLKLDENGQPRKRGRPRKHPPKLEASGQQAGASGANQAQTLPLGEESDKAAPEGAEMPKDTSQKKRKYNPVKRSRAQVQDDKQESSAEPTVPLPLPSPPKKKRGRPRKDAVKASASELAAVATEPSATSAAQTEGVASTPTAALTGMPGKATCSTRVATSTSSPAPAQEPAHAALEEVNEVSVAQMLCAAVPPPLPPPSPPPSAPAPAPTSAFASPMPSGSESHAASLAEGNETLAALRPDQGENQDQDSSSVPASPAVESQHSVRKAKKPKEHAQGRALQEGTNASAKKRAELVLAAVRENGGIMDSSALPAAFAAVAQKDNDPSAAGLSVVDSKTRTRCLQRLEAEGRIKITKTFWARSTFSLNRFWTVVWIPDMITDQQRDEFLLRGTTNSQPTQRYEVPDLGDIVVQRKRDQLKNQDELSTDVDDATSTTTTDSAQTLLAKYTKRMLNGQVDLSGSCGLIPGKLARCRFWHKYLYALVGEKIVDVETIWQTMPLGQLFKVVSTQEIADPIAVKHHVEDEKHRKVKINQLPDDIKALVWKPRLLRLQLVSLMRVLWSLGLAIPTDEASNAAEADTKCFSRYWKLATHDIPVFNWRNKPDNDPLPSQVGVTSIAQAGDLDRHWQDFENRARNPFANTTPVAVVPRKDTAAFQFFPRCCTSSLTWRQGFLLNSANINMIEKYMIIADDKFWERGNELQELADALGAPTWALKQFFEKRIKEPNFTQRTRNVFQDLAAEDRKIVRARIGLKASTVKRQRREWFNNRLEEALDQFPAAREERDFLEKHLSAHRAKWIAGALDVTIGDMRIMIKTSVRKAADSVHRRKGKLASKTPRTKGPLDGPAKRACRTAAPGDFQWTPQIDEVLRDCAAILRARHVARGHRRVNWSAIAQVFSHFRNPSMECKRRLEHLQEVHVGEVEYLAALQAEWMRVWKKHAGTPALPDDDPRDVVNFDLRAHVLFLRKNVDKDAVLSVAEGEDIDDLPLDTIDLSTQWLPNANERRQGLLENFFALDTKATQDTRETDPLLLPFTKDITTAMSPEIGALLPRAAVKMVFISDSDRAKGLEAVGRQFGTTAVNDAIQALHQSAFLRMENIAECTATVSMADQSLRTSRELSDFRNPFSLDQWRAAHEFLSGLPPLSKVPLDLADGSATALVSRFAAGSLDFTVERAGSADLANGAFNAKLLDDEDVEVPVHVVGSPSAMVDFPPDAIPAPNTVHTLQKADPRLLPAHLLPFQSKVQEVHDQLLKAGAKGIVGANLEGDTASIIGAFDANCRPFAFWTGYDRHRLVLYDYLDAWTVRDFKGDSHIVPNRWTDLDQALSQDRWKETLHTLLSLILLRPGLSLATLRQLLVPAVDRVEICTVISVAIGSELLYLYTADGRHLNAATWHLAEDPDLLIHPGRLLPHAQV